MAFNEILLLCLCLTSHQHVGHMETGAQLKDSSDRLVKPGIEPGTSGLQGKWFIHYTTAAPSYNEKLWDIIALGECEVHYTKKANKAFAL